MSKIRIPLGSFDEWGFWYPNKQLEMSVINQFINNMNAGYIRTPKHKTTNDVVIEMKLLHLFGCAHDISDEHYKVEMVKAKIREQPYFNWSSYE